MEKEKNKNSKKEIKVLFILLLLIIAICGSIGYGVYSYYWAVGEFTMGNGVNLVGEFDPLISTDSNSSDPSEASYNFAGADNTADYLLKCPETLDPSSTNTCTATFYVNNLGDSKVRYDISNITTKLENENYENNIWQASTPRISKDSFVVNPNEYDSFTIEVDITTDSDGVSSTTGVEATETVDLSGDIRLTVDFDVEATQILE